MFLNIIIKVITVLQLLEHAGWLLMALATIFSPHNLLPKRKTKRKPHNPPKF